MFVFSLFVFPSPSRVGNGAQVGAVAVPGVDLEARALTGMSFGILTGLIKITVNQVKLIKMTVVYVSTQTVDCVESNIFILIDLLIA